MDAIDWKAEATLLMLGDHAHAATVRLDRGRLSDMINRAIASEKKDRAKLFIQFVDNAHTMPFSDMAALAQRPDFPLVI
jgi:hypothetical protein